VRPAAGAIGERRSESGSGLTRPWQDGWGRDIPAISEDDDLRRTREKGVRGRIGGKGTRDEDPAASAATERMSLLRGEGFTLRRTFLRDAMMGSDKDEL
jgi:hypothetical protein